MTTDTPSANATTDLDWLTTETEDARRAAAAGDPVTSLKHLYWAQRALDAEIRTQVAAARATGTSWADIGQRLGTSRQAAWERFSPSTPEGTA